MGIFDKLKSTAKQAVNTAATSAVSAIGSKRETFTFTSLPESLAELQALPEASMDTPFKTAALTVLPERPLPRRKDLSAFYLLHRLDA